MKRMLMFLFVLVMVSGFSVSAYAFFKSEAEKFEEKISFALKAHKNGLIAESRESLKSIYSELKTKVFEEPDNNDLLFVLAKCEFLVACNNRQRNCQEAAHKKFKILISKERSFELKAFNFYCEQSKRYKIVGDFQRGIELAIVAYRDFQSNQMRVRKAAQEFYESGRLALSDGNVNQGKLYFWSAMELNPSLQKNAKRDILKACKEQTNPNQGLKVLRLVYDITHNQNWPEANKIAVNLISKRKPENAKLISKEFPAFANYPQKAKIVIVSIIFPPDYITTTKKSFIVYCSDGEPSKYYRTSSNNLRILWKSSKNHFLLELRSGKSFTPEEIKKKKVYIGKEEFRIVPTKKDPLDVCIDVI